MRIEGQSPAAAPRRSIRRHEVLQGLLALFDDPSYLEVGVAKGVTFHNIQAASKVAVDPGFRFDVEASRVQQPEAVYHQVTSDEFFGEIVDPTTRFDVIYLDGLHTFEQTLRDFTNALCFLSPQGVIVVDDIYPSSYVASLPDSRESRALRLALGVESREWMGDVYRLAFFIETFCQQYEFRTISDNHGQLVVWRQRRASVADRALDDVARLTYSTTVLQRDVFRFTPYQDILDEVRAALNRARNSTVVAP